jgi:hypothetical protein
LTAGLFGSSIGIVAFRYEDNCYGPRASASYCNRGYFADLLRTIQPRRIRRLVWLFFMMEVVLACFYERLPLLLQEHQVPSLIVGLYGAYIGSMIVLTCVVIVPILQRYTPIEASIAGAFALLLGAGAMVFGETSLMRIWLTGIPLAIGAAVVYCLTMARLTECTDPADQGKIAGVATWAAGLAFVVAGAVMGSGAGSQESLPSGVIAALAGLGMFLSKWGARSELPLCSPGDESGKDLRPAISAVTVHD